MSQPVHAPGAPPAIGPYVHARRLPLPGATLVYTSGQIALDPATGALVAGGIAAETERVIDNLSAVLAACGLGLAHVLKTTVYLIDMDDFAAMNEVYARRFPDPPPARTTIAVTALPRGGRVEIEVVAAGPAS